MTQPRGGTVRQSLEENRMESLISMLLRVVALLLLRLFGTFLFKVLYRIRVNGLDNVPLNGKLILASNHASFLDPMAIFHFSPRRFHAVTGKWLFKIWWLRWVFTATSCIPINGSCDGAIATLNKGETILIFPEGICVPKGKQIPIAKMHKGVAVLTLKTAAKVVPIYVKGTFEAWPRQRFFPKIFKSLELTFGKPLYFGQMDMEVIPQDILYAVTTKIMEEINNLSGKML